MADLRNRSTARWRAVVVSQAPGLRGTPVSGQVLTATAKASWADSSATSQSPVTRINVATMRPHSSRKAVATALSTSVIASPLRRPAEAAAGHGRAWRQARALPVLPAEAPPSGPQPFFVSQKILSISAIWVSRSSATDTSVECLVSPAVLVAFQKMSWRLGYFSRCGGLK